MVHRVDELLPTWLYSDLVPGSVHKVIWLSITLEHCLDNSLPHHKTRNISAYAHGLALTRQIPYENNCSLVLKAKYLWEILGHQPLQGVFHVWSVRPLFISWLCLTCLPKIAEFGCLSVNWFIQTYREIYFDVTLTVHHWCSSHRICLKNIMFEVTNTSIGRFACLIT